jgi:arginase
MGFFSRANLHNSLPLLTKEKEVMRKIKFLVMMSELGAGTRGASLGFKALETAALNRQNHLFSQYPLEHITTKNEALYNPITTPFGKHITDIADVYDHMEQGVIRSLNEGYFPVILAGDHSTAGGSIAGFKSVIGPNARLGVIWIDAHADLHSPHTSPSGNVHGMPVATAIGEDNLLCKRNEIVGETKQAWDRMKGPSPRVRKSDIAFIAVRDYEKEEAYLMEQYGIPNFTVDQVRENGAAKIAQHVLEYLSECDAIYVGFDVDALDSSISIGTGTPVPNGLWPEEVKEMFQVFAAQERVIGMEMVEVNPTLDNKQNTMAETALDILVHSIEEFKTPRNA